MVRGKEAIHQSYDFKVEPQQHYFKGTRCGMLAVSYRQRQQRLFSSLVEQYNGLVSVL